MKKILTVLVFTLVFIAKNNAQLHLANGAVLHINDGATITALNTNISLQSNITATNNGKLIAKGNTVQTINGNGNKIKNLELQTTNKVQLLSNVEVDGNLNFTQGKFDINKNTFTLSGSVNNASATNSFIGSDSSKMIVTTGTGTAFFDQTTSADANNITGTNALQNLSKTGSGSFVVGNKINVFNQLAATAGTIDLGGNVVLRSTANNTAYLDKVTGNIVGQAIVERYIHKQQRGWRAITAPISFNGISFSDSSYSVKQNWQSDWGYTNNYGTRITGPVVTATNGLDEYSPGSSLQKYNSTSGAWDKVTNTYTETQTGNATNAANKAFYMFVRGDRSVTAATSTPANFVATTLAAKGKLQTGTQTYTFSGTVGKSWLIGNPYPCPIDMETVAYNNLETAVYAWDPNLTGFSANTTGNYCAFDITNWAAGPVSGNSTKFFQSGQAFFVKPAAANASIVFTENNKATSTQNNTQTTGSINMLADIFNIKLYHIKADGSKVETDGTRAKFGATYSANVDANDAIKFTTAGIENLSLKRNNKNLTIEARPYITTVDTLFLDIQNLNIGANYEFKMNPINFDASVSSCMLVDNFLGTQTPVSLTAVSNMSFNITSVAGSNNANRFYIVFAAGGILPINNLVLKATKQASSVAINWLVTGEKNVTNYIIEKSVNNKDYEPIEVVAAKNIGNTNYSSLDKKPAIGNNYYRIKANNITGNYSYSNTAAVNFETQASKGFTIYPNPITDNKFILQLNNMKAGKYTINIYNMQGQIILVKQLQHNGNNTNIAMQFATKVAAGTYNLALIDEAGMKESIEVVVAEN